MTDPAAAGGGIRTNHTEIYERSCHLVTDLYILVAVDYFRIVTWLILGAVCIRCHVFALTKNENIHSHTQHITLHIKIIFNVKSIFLLFLNPHMLEANI
jgi:hypothetical protein